MECIPSDIVLDILSRLPVESVWDCKLVSKRWLNLLSHRWKQFAKMHHQHQLFQIAGSDDVFSSSTGLLFSFEKDQIGAKLCYRDNKCNDEMNIHENYSYKTLQKTSISSPDIFGWTGIVGSCNGLICFNKCHHGIPDPIHICNPITGEYVNLPEYTVRETHYDQEYYGAAYGFGYVHSVTNDQYKVVRIYYPGSDNFNNGEVQVYTIGSGSGWRTIGTTSYLLFTKDPKGTYVNGSLHWIDFENKKIVAFNLADEEFRLVQTPHCYNPPHSCSCCFYMLLEFRMNLCFFHQNTQEHLLDIWCPKKNATETSWSRDFSISYHCYECPVRPLLVTQKNEVLFVHHSKTIYCYDPKTNTVINLWNDDEKFGPMEGITAVPHMNSFVSLKALGERCESKKKVIDRSLEDTEY